MDRPHSGHDVVVKYGEEHVEVVPDSLIQTPSRLQIPSQHSRHSVKKERGSHLTIKNTHSLHGNQSVGASTTDVAVKNPVESKPSVSNRQSYLTHKTDLKSADNEAVIKPVESKLSVNNRQSHPTHKTESNSADEAMKNPVESKPSVSNREVLQIHKSASKLDRVTSKQRGESRSELQEKVTPASDYDEPALSLDDRLVTDIRSATRHTESLSAVSTVLPDKLAAPLASSPVSPENANNSAILPRQSLTHTGNGMQSSDLNTNSHYMVCNVTCKLIRMCRSSSNSKSERCDRCTQYLNRQWPTDNDT